VLQWSRAPAYLGELSMPAPQQPYVEGGEDAQQALSETAALARSTLSDAIGYAKNAGHTGSKYAEAAEAMASIAANQEAIFGLNELQASAAAGPSQEEQAAALKLPARHGLNATPTPHRNPYRGTA
jgi:hypothetical protein